MRQPEVSKYAKTIKETKPDFSETGTDLLFAPLMMLLRKFELDKEIFSFYGKIYKMRVN